MPLPKFVSVQFYPGYAYGNFSAAGRYVALGEDGRVYVFTMDGAQSWSLLGDYPDV